MIKKILPIFITLVFISISLNAQLKPGQWRGHLPYHLAKKIVFAKNRVYACSDNSLFYYNLDDLSINKLSKLEGLSDVGFSTIEYAPKNDMLIIAYQNSNIDFIHNNSIKNFPYIKNKITIPDRKISDILVIDSTAYLSCGFGIVVIDLNKLQVKDTYYPGINQSVNAVYSTCSDGEYLYAATNSGILKAKLSDPYLADYSNWQLVRENIGDKKCKTIQLYKGRLYALFPSKDIETSNDTLVYQNSDFTWAGLRLENWTQIKAIKSYGNLLYVTTNTGSYRKDDHYDFLNFYPTFSATYAASDGSYEWLCDLYSPIVRRKPDGNFEKIEPNSPFYPEIVKMDLRNGVLWTVSGGKEENWNSSFKNHGAEMFYNDTWYNYNPLNNTTISQFVDIINVKIDPNDNQHAFLSSWTFGGLAEYKDGNFSVIDESNSLLKAYHPPYNVKENHYKIAGLDYDKEGNLWITNSEVSKPLVERTKNGKWYSYSLGSLGSKNLGDVLATSWGDKWVLVANSTTSTSLIAFNEHSLDNDADDDYINFDIAGIESLNQSLFIYCIVEDKNGNIWVGTEAGPVRFDTPKDVFTSTGASPKKIKIPVVKGKKEAAFLLETEKINSIAVDAADRKWFGTQNSGAYLISADGMTQIEHFNIENSPLLSNTIVDIKIDDKTGEVFFATDKGLISYRGFATEGEENFNNVYVYPNPVRENYNGKIIVSGMIKDAIIKITDISGNLVAETKSLGGQAVWDGKNLLGKRVNTGVYLVFCSNNDGTKTYITKLLFIH